MTTNIPDLTDGQLATEMTDRQLAAQVRFGRKVTFETPDLKAKSVTGYCMGFDEDNIRLAVLRADLIPAEDAADNALVWQIENRAIRRDYIAAIEFHDRPTMSSEPLARELDQMVKLVRTELVEKYFPDRVDKYFSDRVRR